jgi:hypothetical protein
VNGSARPIWKRSRQKKQSALIVPIRSAITYTWGGGWVGYERGRICQRSDRMQSDLRSRSNPKCRQRAGDDRGPSRNRLPAPTTMTDTRLNRCAKLAWETRRRPCACDQNDTTCVIILPLRFEETTTRHYTLSIRYATYDDFLHKHFIESDHYDKYSSSMDMYACDLRTDQFGFRNVVDITVDRRRKKYAALSFSSFSGTQKYTIFFRLSFYFIHICILYFMERSTRFFPNHKIIWFKYT